MNKNSLNMEVATLIAKRRKSCGITQVDMAERLDLEKETISRIENGKIAISLDRLAEFAKELNCSPQDLLAFASNKFLVKLDSIIYMLEPLPEKEQNVLLKFMKDAIQLFLEQRQ